MKKELRNNLLAKLADNNQEGEALRDYLEEQIGRLDRVEGLETMEEVKGRQYAIETLKKIFRMLTPKKGITEKGIGRQYL